MKTKKEIGNMANAQVESTGKKSSGNGASRKNELGGFLVGKLDGKMMREFVAENDLKIDVDVTDEQLGVALAMHFKDTVSKADQVRCDIADGGCGAVSSIQLECCPFCGDGGEVEGDDEDEEEVSTAAATKTELDDEEDADNAIDEEEADQEQADRDTNEALEAADDADDADELEEEAGDDGHIPDANDGEDEDDQEEVAAAPPAPKKTAAKKTTKKEPEMEAATTNGAGTKKGAHATSKTALARPAAATPAVVLTTKDLDKKITEVAKLSSAVAKSVYEGAENYWQLGRALVDINANQLWKLRTAENGKPKYKSWDTFVTAELGMSPQHSYAAMDVARGYETPEEVVALGQTKAALLLKAAPEDRPALAEAAKAGASVREISKGVQESRAKNGSQKKTQQAKAGAKGGSAKAKTAATRSEKVSVTAMEGSTTIKLYKRPTSLKGLDLSTLTRAKKLGDMPFGRYEMANGIVQTFHVLQKESGELILKIETRREES